MKHIIHTQDDDTQLTYLGGVGGASEGSGDENEDSRKIHCFLGYLLEVSRKNGVGSCCNCAANGFMSSRRAQNR